MLFKGRFNGEIEIKTSTSNRWIRIEKKLKNGYLPISEAWVVLALISKIFEF
jgi:hypothetical protein